MIHLYISIYPFFVGICLYETTFVGYIKVFWVDSLMCSIILPIFHVFLYEIQQSLLGNPQIWFKSGLNTNKPTRLARLLDSAVQHWRGSRWNYEGGGGGADLILALVLESRRELSDCCVLWDSYVAD